MIEIFMIYLSIPSRINFLQLVRYSLFGEQRFRGKFEQDFDFFSFNIKPCGEQTSGGCGLISKSLERNILLVVELFLLKGKPIYRLLFSTDTTQAPIDVIDIYHARFQIEFGFRDAKQFAGLENPEARSGNKLNFHFNAALTMVNIAKLMQLTNPLARENSFSMVTYKTLFHNAFMLSRFFRMFAINPNSIKNRQHVN